MKRIIYILALAVGLAACKKDPQPVEVYEPTPMEQTKQNLDSLGANMAKALGLSADDNLTEYILDNTKVSTKPIGTVTLTLDGKEGTVMRATFIKKLGKTKVEIALVGDMLIRGYVDIGKFLLHLHPTQDDIYSEALDEGMDLTLYYRDEAMATLGIEPYHQKEAGEDVWKPLPVFRFSDGTSYAVSSTVLVEQFIDYFLLNEGAKN